MGGGHSKSCLEPDVRDYHNQMLLKRWMVESVFVNTCLHVTCFHKSSERKINGWKNVNKLDSVMFVFTVQSFNGHFSESNTHRYKCRDWKARVLRLMCTPLRAAGCVYQWIPTVPGANSAGLSLTSINLLWQCEETHPARGSNTLLFLPLFPSNSLNFPYPFCSQPHFISPSCFPRSLCLTLLLIPLLTSHPPYSSPLSLPASPLPPSDLIPPLNLSSVKWCTRNAEVVNLWEVRSIKQGQAERSTQRKCILFRGWAQQAINPAIRAVCWAEPVGRPHHCPRHPAGAKDWL